MKNVRKAKRVRKCFSLHRKERRKTNKLDWFERKHSLTHTLSFSLGTNPKPCSLIPMRCGQSTKQHKKILLCRGRGMVVFGVRHRHRYPWRPTTWTPTNTYPHTIPSPTLPRETSLVSDQLKTPSILSLSSFSSAPSSSAPPPTTTLHKSRWTNNTKQNLANFSFFF